MLISLARNDQHTTSLLVSLHSGEEKTVMAERISLQDKTLFLGYSNHIQRYVFASNYIAGRRVLDAGCGTGYGSVFLATRGASSVTAIDISDEALAEANRLYHRDNLRFIKGDVERLSEIPDLGSLFDVVINLENIEHLAHPAHFLEETRRQLTTEGILVVSTPNGELTERDDAGRILNPFHVQEFTESASRALEAVLHSDRAVRSVEDARAAGTDSFRAFSL